MQGTPDDELVLDAANEGRRQEEVNKLIDEINEVTRRYCSDNPWACTGKATPLGGSGIKKSATDTGSQIEKGTLETKTEEDKRLVNKQLAEKLINDEIAKCENKGDECFGPNNSVAAAIAASVSGRRVDLRNLTQAELDALQRLLNTRGMPGRGTPSVDRDDRAPSPTAERGRDVMNLSKPVPRSVAVVKDPTTERDEDFVDFSKLPIGGAVAKAPKTAKRDEDFHVVLVVSPQGVDAILQSLRSNSSPNTQLLPKGNVLMSRVMVAELSAPGLKIDPKGPVTRTLDRQTGATWEWLVRAEKGGTYNLLLSASVIKTRQDGTTKDMGTFTTYKQEIEIKVTPLEWLSDNWQYLAGAIVLPGLAWMWKIAKQRLSPREPNWDG